MEYESLVTELTDIISQKIRRINEEIKDNHNKMNDRIEYLVQGIIHDFWITQVPDKELLAEFYYIVGNGYAKSKERKFLTKSISFLTEAVHLFRKTNKIDNFFSIYNNLGACYFVKGNIILAEKNYYLALDQISSESEQRSKRCSISVNLAALQTTKGNYNLAIKELHKALSLIEIISSEKEEKIIGSIYYHLAINYLHTGEFTKSIEFYRLGIEFGEYSDNLNNNIIELINNLETIDNDRKREIKQILFQV